MKRGDRVVVYISNRHDFQRYATIINVDRDDATVRYDNGEVEIVPLSWIE